MPPEPCFHAANLQTPAKTHGPKLWCLLQSCDLLDGVALTHLALRPRLARLGLADLALRAHAVLRVRVTEEIRHRFYLLTCPARMDVT